MILKMLLKNFGNGTMNKDKVLSFRDYEEFADALKNKDINFATIITNSILESIRKKSKRKNVHIISIAIEDEGRIYDLTIGRKEFKDILEQNLKTHEEKEDYETCANIIKGLKQIKNEKNN